MTIRSVIWATDVVRRYALRSREGTGEDHKLYDAKIDTYTALRFRYTAYKTIANGRERNTMRKELW